MNKLTHIDDDGAARMVDVSDKDTTERVALACATVRMLPETLKMIVEGSHKKGDVLAVARIAGIQAAKQCSNLIPLCHPLMLTSVTVDLDPDEKNNFIDDPQERETRQTPARLNQVSNMAFSFKIPELAVHLKSLHRALINDEARMAALQKRASALVEKTS